MKTANLIVRFNFAKLQYAFVQDLYTFVDKKPQYVHINKYDQCAMSFDFENEQIASQKKKDLLSFYGKDIFVIDSKSQNDIVKNQYRDKLKDRIDSGFSQNYEMQIDAESEIDQYKNELKSKYIRLKKQSTMMNSKHISTDFITKTIFPSNDDKSWESWNEIST